MPKSKRKSKPRKLMSPEELRLARIADAKGNESPTFPSFRCHEVDLKALDTLTEFAESTPTYKALLLRTDDHHKGYAETRGKKGKGGKSGIKSAVQRLLVRSGTGNLFADIPINITPILTTLREPRDVYRRELRYLMLEYLHDQYPETALDLLTYHRGRPYDIDVIIDGRLMTSFLIKPDAGDLYEWDSYHEVISGLWDSARMALDRMRQNNSARILDDCLGDSLASRQDNPLHNCLNPLPFFNPYSDNPNT